MNIVFPTHLRLLVVQASATMSLLGEDGISRSSESFSLVLRATHDTNVALSTGERLSDVDVHLTLSTKWRTPQELDKDLTNEDVGFLAHTEGERGEPFVHGGALLSNTTVVAALLSAGTDGTVTLVLPTVPITNKKEAPFVWGRNRLNMLRINHLEVSVHRGEGVQSDSSQVAPSK